MSLAYALEYVTGSASNNLKNLATFLGFTSTAITESIPKPNQAELKQTDAEALRKMGELLQDVSTAMADREPRSKRIAPGKRLEVPMSDPAAKFIAKAATAIAQQHYLAEMGLVYGMAIFECFIKDYIQQLFLYRSDILRGGASISYEDLARFRTLEEVWGSAAEREASNLGHGGIDDIGFYLQKRFSVDIRGTPVWLLLREASLRRNLIVHNSGRPDAAYRVKLGLADNADIAPTDLKYVLNILDAMSQAMQIMHQQLTAKFVK
jgi:hypothetical protein